MFHEDYDFKKLQEYWDKLPPQEKIRIHARSGLYEQIEQMVQQGQYGDLSATQLNQLFIQALNVRSNIEARFGLNPYPEPQIDAYTRFNNLLKAVFQPDLNNQS
jgi:hypothetical protein